MTEDKEPKFLPPGLEPGGSWLPAIRREIRNFLAEGDSRMSIQEFSIEQHNRMCLLALRHKHCELGYKGQCIVRFDPCHFLTVLDLPGFVRIHQYRYMTPLDPLEVGGVEVFRMVPSSPIDYAAVGVW